MYIYSLVYITPGDALSTDGRDLTSGSGVECRWHHGSYHLSCSVIRGTLRASHKFLRVPRRPSTICAIQIFMLDDLESSFHHVFLYVPRIFLTR